MEKRIVICNSTILINFATIEEIDLLRKLFGSLIVPDAVWHELVLEDKDYKVSRIVKNAKWIRRESVLKSDNALYRTLSRELDAGEAEVIVLALEKKADLVLLDETEARDLAEFHGLNFIGSIGCLVEAKRSGLVSKIKPLLDKMIDNAQYWVSEELYKNVLMDNKEYDVS